MQSNTEQKWLVGLTKAVLSGLGQCLPPESIRLKRPSELELVASNTDGWYISIGRVRGNRSTELQIWFDDWARAGSRRVSFCICARSMPPIEKLVALENDHSDTTPVFFDDAWAECDDGHFRLVVPLPKQKYGRPLAELYRTSGSWSFISLYHGARPVTSAPPPNAIVQAGNRFFRRFVGMILGAQADRPGTFPDHVNKVKMRYHTVRERPTAAARYAKLRDGYRCRVCEFSFPEMYGRLGEGFAEAHHTVPLSVLTPNTPIRQDDLITVCANCHRMLHRLAGNHDDHRLLKKMIETVRRKRSDIEQ